MHQEGGDHLRVFSFFLLIYLDTYIHTYIHGPSGWELTDVNILLHGREGSPSPGGLGHDVRLPPYAHTIQSHTCHVYMAGCQVGDDKSGYMQGRKEEKG